MVITHTDCGMLTFSDEESKQTVHADTGLRPGWSPEAFQDLDEHIRHSIRRIRTSPFIPHTDQIRGFVFDIATGRLHETHKDGRERHSPTGESRRGWCSQQPLAATVGRSLRSRRCSPLMDAGTFDRWLDAGVGRLCRWLR